MNAAPYLAPVEKPKGVLLRLVYAFTRRQFGQVPGPLSVFCARMPGAFTRFYAKPGMLDRKLALAPETAVLIRQRVASLNMCLFCLDAGRWAALHKAGVEAAKLDALGDFRRSPLFSEAERAALAFATELTEDRHVGGDTFAEVARHFTEREICEIVFLVASEHLYNINNIGLNIGSSGMCEVPVAA
jgi:alkylhydroperoxidase family enzyme